jgi:hypothetical protein
MLVVANGFAQLVDLALDGPVIHSTLLPIFRAIFLTVLGGSCHG